MVHITVLALMLTLTATIPPMPVIQATILTILRITKRRQKLPPTRRTPTGTLATPPRPLSTIQPTTLTDTTITSRLKSQRLTMRTLTTTLPILTNSLQKRPLTSTTPETILCAETPTITTQLMVPSATTPQSPSISSE